MGAAIARRMAGAGHAVTVWNRTPDRAAPLAGEGIAVAARAAEATAAGRDLVIAMLADGTATRAVLLDGAVRQALPDGAVLCDMATSGVPVAVELAGAYGPAFVDAPVSGSVP